MEECNQAYMDAMSVTCSPTMEPATLYEPVVSELASTDVTDPASNWMFNQQNNNGDVQAALGLGDLGSNTLAVVQDDDGNQQYVVVDTDGRVYPTCIQHGASGTACSPNYVCWNGATAGSASEQRSALLQAAERNNFQNAGCPTISSDDCSPLSGFYADDLAARGMGDDVFANLCVGGDGTLKYVTRDAYKSTCIGFGTNNARCPPEGSDARYFCPATNGGVGSFGWPAQFGNSVEAAYNAAGGSEAFDADMFTHPDCQAV